MFVVDCCRVEYSSLRFADLTDCAREGINKILVQLFRPITSPRLLFDGLGSVLFGRKVN